VQAEAVAGLIDSVSSQAARSAIRSLEGEFSNNINDLLQRLINLRVLVESVLDFPEEEIDFIEDADIKEKLTACIEDIDRILVRARQGTILSNGLQLAIVGSPNVGKSTLLNRLAGREAAIVSTSPGTTRDIVEENILIEGAPLNILDTAGIRDTRDEIEEEGVKRALNAASRADIIVLLIEYGQNIGKEEQCVLDTLPENVKIVVVKNKVDLSDNKDELLAKNRKATEVFLSAKTGEGVDDLVQKLKIIMGMGDTGEDSYMARARHLNALLKTQEYLTTGQQRLENKNTLELLAEDLRMAQESLGTITGSFAADDLLGEIFSKFCIGK
jgi:tRNA modification GTPase